MKEAIKQIIIDFHKEDIPLPSPRDMTIPNLAKHIRKAYVFIGMRRSGKTWTLYQHMQDLMKNGVNKNQILYIDFEDDRLIGFKHENFQDILDAYFELYPHFIEEENLYFFFDEIHEINGWQKFIRRLLDKEKMQLFISGSSAKMLSKEIASNLRGRTLTQEIFPFSFKEYLNYKDFNFSSNLSSKEKAVLFHHCQHYLKYGGFPEALDIPDQLFRQLLQGYITTVVYRDIVERHQVQNINILKKLLVQCIENSASLISINKIYQSFKSNGEIVGKNILYDFMAYFEDAYCLMSIPIYTHSAKKRDANPKKIYAIDQGLISAYSIKFGFDQSALLETTVFSHLRRKVEDIFYYKTASGKEIDFLTITPQGQINLYQVCFSMKSPTTIEREKKALFEAMQELKLSKATIITFDLADNQSFKQSALEINCIPFAFFMS